MPDVYELRVALTVEDFDQAVAFYRDALGLAQLEDWSSDTGRVVLLEAGRATLELLDEAQAAAVDEIEAGERVSGAVRIAVEVLNSTETARRLVAARGGRRRPGRSAGAHALGRPKRTRQDSRRHAAHTVQF